MKFVKLFSILFLALMLLAVAVEAQRGGGGRSRSSSRGRSWGRSRSRSWGWGSSGNSTSDGTTSSGTNNAVTIGIIGVAGVFGYFVYMSNQSKQKERKQKIENLFLRYQGQNESKIVTMSDEEMNAAKDWFMSQKWKMKFNTENGSFHDEARITIKDIKARSKSSYEIKMELNDSIGKSYVTGVLMHQRNYFGIIFEKTYADRNNAGQTGSFDLLIYEGVQQGEEFRGRWSYQGYESNSQYCGSFTMSHR